MIVSVSLNPSIDRMVEIDSFQYGGMNRIQKIRSEDAAGKGMNVALAAKILGLDVACIGFLPEKNGSLLEQRLHKAGCEYDFIPIKGSVRINTKIYDREKGTVTELNETGSVVTSENLEAMMQLIQKWQDKASVFVLTGSLPPGCPEDFYRQLILQTKVRCILDTEGEKLLKGVEAQPFLIKPNVYELELAVKHNLPEKEDMVAAAHALIAGRISHSFDTQNENRNAYKNDSQKERLALVSMGNKGAFITDAKQSWIAPCIPVEVKSTVGAGDCMVAGILFGLASGIDMKNILRCAMAAGTAGCLTEGTQLLREKDFVALLQQVQIEELITG